MERWTRMAIAQAVSLLFTSSLHLKQNWSVDNCHPGFNATLVATDVGSTFGPRSKYACVNKVPASNITSALCCKFQTVRVSCGC